MRLLVCGDRNWNDYNAIYRNMVMLADDTVIIHGACRGADSIAGACAMRLGLQVEAYPADWRTHGRAAGPIRNRQMLVDGKPDWIWAFHSNLPASKGTLNMVTLARKAGIPVEVFDR